MPWVVVAHSVSPSAGIFAVVGCFSGLLCFVVAAVVVVVAVGRLVALSMQPMMMADFSVLR